MKYRVIAAVIMIVGFACKKKETAPVPGAGSGPPATTTQPPPAAAVAAAGGTLSNAAKDAVTLTCQQAAKDVPGNTGTSWYMRCPACTEHGSVWGTDLYTDDSNLCAAALHAGAIPGAGGVVLVTWMSGQGSYVGSKKNGIESSDYGKWERSFFVQSVDAQGRPTSPPATPPPAGTLRVSCAMNAEFSGDATYRASCPPGCKDGRVYGTDVYTSDSTLCLAAIHAGLATVEKGGDVTVTIGGPKDSFAASERNGIASQAYGQFGKSVTFAK